MSIKAKLISGRGQPWAAGVSRDQALMVELRPTRRAGIDADLATAEKLYREWFTSSANSPLMNVLGSFATPVKFLIDSKPDRLLAVYGLRLLFESANMDISGTEIRRFGPANFGAALTNGLLLTAIQGGVSTSIFLDPVLAVGDFLNYTDAYFSRVDGVANGTDILNFHIEFEVPIFLPAGSVDRIEFSVRDDLRLISSFKALAYGTQELSIA